MNETQRHGGWLIFLTFLGAFVLTAIPLPEGFEPLRPSWVALVLVYWCLALPMRVGVGTAWVCGVLLDVVQGVMLGQHALGMVLIGYVANNFHQRIRLYARWQQSLALLGLVLLYQLLAMIVRGFSGNPTPGLTYWLAAPATMAFWPATYHALRGLRHHFKVT